MLSFNNFFLFKLKKIQQFTNSYPALFILVPVLITLIPTVINPNFPILITCFLSIFALSVISFFISKKTIIITIIITITAFCSLWIHNNLPKNHYSHLVFPPCSSAQIEFEIVDPALTATPFPHLSMPKLIEIKMLRLKKEDRSKWITCSGNTLIRLPMDQKHELLFGQHFQAKGVFQLAENPVFPSGFNFATYLQSRNIPYLFQIQTLQQIEREASFLNKMYTPFIHIRDFFLINATRNLAIETKNLTAALLFGCKQGINANSKLNFLRAGVIHAFAVSGLHIAMLLALFLWIFRPLPISIRYYLIIFVLFLYALSTGFQAASFRAWFMFSLFCALKASKYATIPLNTLAISAIVLVIYRPIWIIDPGFQYSFIATAFLILSWHPIREWLATLCSHLLYIPSNHLKFKHHFIRFIADKPLSAIAACMVGTASSSPITMYYNGFFNPLSTFLNILVIPLIWITFTAALIKAFIPFSTFLDYPLNGIIEGSFSTLNIFCRMITNPYTQWGYFGSISIFAILILYISFLIFLFAKNIQTFLISFAIFIFTFISPFIINQISPPRPQCFIISGIQLKRPSIIYLDTAKGIAGIINSPGYEAIQSLPSFLYQSGIDRIHTILMTSPNFYDFKTLTYLANYIPIHQIIAPKVLEKNQEKIQNLFQTENQYSILSFSNHSKNKLHFEIKSKTTKLKLPNNETLQMIFQNHSWKIITPFQEIIEIPTTSYPSVTKINI